MDVIEVWLRLRGWDARATRRRRERCVRCVWEGWDFIGVIGMMGLVMIVVGELINWDRFWWVWITFSVSRRILIRFIVVTRRRTLNSWVWWLLWWKLGKLNCNLCFCICNNLNLILWMCIWWWIWRRTSLWSRWIARRTRISFRAAVFCELCILWLRLLCMFRILCIYWWCF